MPIKAFGQSLFLQQFIINSKPRSSTIKQVSKGTFLCLQVRSFGLLSFPTLTLILILTLNPPCPTTCPNPCQSPYPKPCHSPSLSPSQSLSPNPSQRLSPNRSLNPNPTLNPNPILTSTLILSLLRNLLIDSIKARYMPRKITIYWWILSWSQNKRPSSWFLRRCKVRANSALSPHRKSISS